VSPKQTQRTVQRSFTKSIGETFTFNFGSYPPGPFTRANCIPLESEGGRRIRYFVDLGTPNRRTEWAIQTIALNFSLWAAIFDEPEHTEAVLSITVLAGGNPVSVDLVALKIPASKNEHETTIQTVATEKLYVLELYSPLSLTGEQLALEFEVVPSEDETAQFYSDDISLTIENPIATVTVAQTFPAF
jgi:hypothetical protein